MKEDLRDDFFRFLNRHPDAKPDELRELSEGFAKAADRREQEGDLL